MEDNTATGAWSGGLSQQCCRTGLFCARAKTLHQAQDKEQNWGENTDGRIRRDEADEEGGSTHDCQRSYQDPLAAKLFTEVRKD